MDIDIKSFDDILKLRDEFSRRLEARMKTFEKPGTGTIDELIEEKRALLKQSKARVETAERAKATFVKRLDAELGRQKETAGRLEKEIADLTNAKKTTGGVTTGERPRARKKKK